MIIKIPDFYNKFQCIADRCKHTCCASWEIDVDERSYQYYCSIDGEFGEQLRTWIKKEKPPKIKMLHGKCPFLDSHQLCKVYQNLGKDAMCQVCTEYPRFEEEYTGTRENALALSCEEVGRLLYSRKDKICFVELEVEDEAAATVEESQVNPLHDHVKQLEYEPDEKIQFIINARNKALGILQDREKTINERLCLFLMYSDRIQKCLDNNQLHNINEILSEKMENEFECDSKNGKTHRELVHLYFQQRMDVICDMEVMEEEWLDEINNVSRMFYSDSMQTLYEQIAAEFREYREESEVEYEHLAVYFAYRYLVESIADGRFFDKARFCIVCFLMVRDMDRMRYLLHGKQFTMEDRIETSRILSKEVEHSQMCLKYLADKIQNESVFHLDELKHQICDN